MNILVKAKQTVTVVFENKFVVLLDDSNGSGISFKSANFGLFSVRRGELVEFDKAGVKVDLINNSEFDNQLSFRVTPFRVVAFDTVEIAKGSSFKVENLPKLQDVKVANPVASVAVNNLPKLQDVNIKSKVTSLLSLPVLIFNTNLKKINAKTNRKEVILRVSETNVGIVWLSSKMNEGVPLYANDIVTLEVSESISLFSETLNNKVYINEVIASG